MTPGATPGTRPTIGALSWAVAILSAAVLGFELSLMRMLLISSWHHFAFLIISVALLGFGSSGTLLCLLRPVLLRRPGTTLLILIIATALAMVLCTALAQHVPVEARFLQALFWTQARAWLVFWLLWLIPFLLGAAAIGLALMAAGDRVAMVYGANMMGSGAGALLATFAMGMVPPAWLATVMGVLTLLGALALLTKGAWMKPAIAIGGAGALIALIVWLDPPDLRIDPNKYLAQLQRLVRQDEAVSIAAAHGPRGLVEIYSSPVLHDVPFLSVGADPMDLPAMDMILVDGHLAGTVPRIRSLEEARFVDHMLMGFAYEVGPRRPRVALLGERGALNIYLALRRGASAVMVVQEDAHIFQMARRALGRQGAVVLSDPAVQVVTSHPRHFMDRPRTRENRFDIIQIVSIEGMAAGSVGMAGLGQDHLVTVEGMSAALEQLKAEGLLFVCRGIQTPPRDNLKLLAVFVEALRRKGVERPAEHIVIVRDYLAVCTIVKATPWQRQSRQIQDLKKAVARRELTPVWFPGILDDDPKVKLNHPDALPQPEGSPGDWFHHGALQLFSDSSDQFIDQWLFDIRPPTDDRPFFFNFYKRRWVEELRRSLPDLWMTHAELGYLFLIWTLQVVAAAALVLSVLPLLLLRSIRSTPGKWCTALYFAAIGLAYLMVEIVVLTWVIRMVGDPVRAAALTIAGFLVFSGLGALMAQRIVPQRTTLVLRFSIGALVLLGIGLWLLFPTAAVLVGLLGPLREVAAVVLIAPLAFLMGLPMPIGLRRLERGAGPLLPWAWAINGFGSVLAPPLATAMGMAIGFSSAILTAMLLYVVAGAAVSMLPGGENR